MVKSESVVLTPGDQLNPVQFQQQLRKAARFKTEEEATRWATFTFLPMNYTLLAVH